MGLGELVTLGHELAYLKPGDWALPGSEGLFGVGYTRKSEKGVRKVLFSLVLACLTCIKVTGH